ncbi:MAG: reverse transcriptase [Polaromonas sp.]|nr:reverse transcriptase [Polaromonas sp.]
MDALFVPEWNQDTETFNALVESAALDIHAYIIQCNDRQYGDSRIRVPLKDNWRRDVLRVKGGIEDYCVTGEIDIKALRQFQSSHRSPNGPFKPVPDGFAINHGRKVLPA